MSEEKEDSFTNSLLIEYDEKTRNFRWKLTGTIPLMELSGVLTLVQSTVTDQQKIRMAMGGNQAGKLVLPGGMPAFK